MSRKDRFFYYSGIPPEDIERIRELVSFRARISIIGDLVQHPSAADAARRLYVFTGGRAPGGRQAPCEQAVRQYRTISAKVTFNTFYTEYDDYRALGVSHADSLICVYRRYHKRVGWLSEEDQVIPFDHWHAVALEIETGQAMVMRCNCCGSRKLLLQKGSMRGLHCVFCELIKANEKSSQIAERSVRRSRGL